MAADASPPSSPKAVHHRRQDVYSEALPIPSIQRFFKRGLAEVVNRDEDSEDESSSSGDQHDGQDSAGPSRVPYSDAEPGHAAARRSHKSRIVDDPITGAKVTIHDVGKKEYHRAMQQADGGHAQKGGEPGGEAPQNTLQLVFPPAEAMPARIRDVHPLLLPLFGAWGVLTAMHLVHPVISVVAAAWLGWWAFGTMRRSVEDHRWERERRRGEGARRGEYSGEADGESKHGIMEGAEWLNQIVESLWAVMNSDLFASLGATLEDVLQASTHGQAFIQAVKVEDLAQGSTPLRLTGFRVLGDGEADALKAETAKAMREQRQGEKTVTMPHERGQGERREARSSTDDVAERSGSFINLELSFLYRARPTTGAAASKSRNAHLLIKFWVGARKWYTVPLPVWVEIMGLVGRVRLRVQLTPDPPFVKNVTFSLMGLPRTQVSVIPLRINTQNIPFLSGFIQSSIDAAVGEYCAPSSMTMDVGEMLMGDKIKREVNALGVVIVYIHRAFELEKQDVRGSSDPYCTLSLSKQGKIRYCTRVAMDDLSPRWEERCTLLIHADAIRAREKVAVSLWDSDRFSADDVLGSAEVDLAALVKRPGRLFRRTDTLVGLTRELKKQGTIQWSLGYFPKTSNRRRLTDSSIRQREEDEAGRLDAEQTAADGGAADDDDAAADEDAALDLDTDEEQLHLPEEEVQQTRHTEQAVAFEPPSPALPSGILSLQIHQITNLELNDTNTHHSSRKAGEAGRRVETVDDEQDHPMAPSAYVSIVLNDETVFRSRAKTLSSNPFFNAGTERFIRDWRRTLVMFVVWDTRLREEDAILGVVPVKLSDVFHASSQVTQFFPIAGGVGQGQIRLSLLFRPVRGTNAHKDKLGWNIGTMRILSSLTATDFTRSFSSTALRLVSIRARTLAGRVNISARRCSLTSKGEGESKSVEWRVERDEMPVKVPVRRRHATPFVVEFRSLSGLGIRRTVAMSIIWMQDIADDDIVEQRLPIWRAKEGHDFHRLLQNYHNYQRESEAEELGVERVGYLYVKLQFKSGAGKVHIKFGKANPDVKAVMDAWSCCAAAGLRSVGGDFAGDNDDERTSADLGDGESDDDDDDEGDEQGRGAHEDENGGRRSRSSGDTDEAGILDKLRKWSDERRELHRQHRGIKQYKVARTASWLGKGVRESGSRAMQGLKVQDRRSVQIESEL